MAPIDCPQIQRFPASADADTIFKAFAEDGLVIIEGFLDRDQVKRFNQEIQPSMDKIPVVATNDGTSYDRTKRFSNLVTTSPTFRHEMLENDLMHQMCERAFSKHGTGVGYHFNDTMVIEVHPGAPAQRLHRDQELFPWWNSMGPDAPECVVNFFCALTPFTADNGSTRFVLGSDRWPKFTYINERDCEQYENIQTVQAVMQPGDCYMLSGKVIHGAGHNATLTDQRRALALAVIRKELRPLQAFPLFIPMDITTQLTARSQAMFGFRSSLQTIDVDSIHFWGKNGKDVGEHLGLIQSV